MIENIKPAESLTVADFKVHPVWEFLNDDEIGETMARPVEKLPVEALDNRIVGAPVRLGNGLEVWGLFGNFDVKNRHATQHFLALLVDRDGKCFTLRAILKTLRLTVQRRLLASLAWALTMYSPLPSTSDHTFEDLSQWLQPSC